MAVTPRTPFRLALAAIPAALSVAAGLLTTQQAPAATTHSLCGTERWTVKTLQDRPSLLAVKTATIAYLTSQPKPSPLPGTRAQFERHVFKVTAQVTQVINEGDGDMHLVLHDGSDHMIAEAPNSTCDSRATASRRNQMAQARAAVTVCTKAEITGVAFFDFFHNQTGVAPNEIELHPILAFHCLTP